MSIGQCSSILGSLIWKLRIIDCAERRQDRFRGVVDFRNLLSQRLQVHALPAQGPRGAGDYGKEAEQFRETAIRPDLPRAGS